ncbi:hypothetical protein B296_00018673 [Ensete ventricosum]|uniref:Uncharacterized protein n=1 Tax=Ensete ventricosum TaxID=4639 RepID=A0A426YFY6_ENSVE|nr:hypothetical protein B296_00018673 [Ensete ventricosum]
MWPTRHGEAGLTQAWKGQRSYDRPDTGKVGKVDTPYLQARASLQGPQTAWKRRLVRARTLLPNPSSTTLAVDHPRRILRSYPFDRAPTLRRGNRGQASAHGPKPAVSPCLLGKRQISH